MGRNVGQNKNRLLCLKRTLFLWCLLLEIWKIIKNYKYFFPYNKISTWEYLKSGIINENIQFENTKFIFNKLGSSY